MASQQILSFYLGQTTPDRKDYIMENLVVPVEWQANRRLQRLFERVNVRRVLHET